MQWGLMNLVYSDIMGPIRVLLLNNSKYIFMFIEHKSWYPKCYFICNKDIDIILNCFKEYKAWFENIIGKHIKVFRMDGGIEYINKDIRTYLKTYSIKY